MPDSETPPVPQANPLEVGFKQFGFLRGILGDKLDLSLTPDEIIAQYNQAAKSKGKAELGVWEKTFNTIQGAQAYVTHVRSLGLAETDELAQVRARMGEVKTHFNLSDNATSDDVWQKVAEVRATAQKIGVTNLDVKPEELQGKIGNSLDNAERTLGVAVDRSKPEAVFQYLADLQKNYHIDNKNTLLQVVDKIIRIKRIARQKLHLSWSSQEEFEQQIRTYAGKKGVEKADTDGLIQVWNHTLDALRDEAKLIGMENATERKPEELLTRGGKPVFKPDGTQITHKPYVLEIEAVISELDRFTDGAVAAGITDARDLPAGEVIKKIGQELKISSTQPIDILAQYRAATKQAAALHVATTFTEMAKIPAFITLAQNAGYDTTDPAQLYQNIETDRARAKALGIQKTDSLSELLSEVRSLYRIATGSRKRKITLDEALQTLQEIKDSAQTRGIARETLRETLREVKTQRKARIAQAQSLGFTADGNTPSAEIDQQITAFLDRAEAAGIPKSDNLADVLAALDQATTAVGVTDLSTLSVAEKFKVVNDMKDNGKLIGHSETDLALVKKAVDQYVGKAGSVGITGNFDEVHKQVQALILEGKEIGCTDPDIAVVKQKVDQFQQDVGYALARTDVSGMKAAELKKLVEPYKDTVGAKTDESAVVIATRLKQMRQNAVTALVENAANCPFELLTQAIDNDRNLTGVEGSNSYEKAEKLADFRQRAIRSNIRGSLNLPNETLAREVKKLGAFLHNVTDGESADSILGKVEKAKSDAALAGMNDAWTTSELNRVVQTIDELRAAAGLAHTRGSENLDAEITDLIGGINTDAYLAEIPQGARPAETAKTIGKMWQDAEIGLRLDFSQQTNQIKTTEALVRHLRSIAHFVEMETDNPPWAIAVRAAYLRTGAIRQNVLDAQNAGIEQLAKNIKQDGFDAGEKRPNPTLEQNLTTIGGLRSDGVLLELKDEQGNLVAGNLTVKELRTKVDQTVERLKKAGVTGNTVTEMVTNLRTDANYVRTNILEAGIVDVNSTSLEKLLEVKENLMRDASLIGGLTNPTQATIQQIHRDREDFRNLAAYYGIAKAQGPGKESIKNLEKPLREQGRIAGITDDKLSLTSVIVGIQKMRVDGQSIGRPNANTVPLESLEAVRDALRTAREGAAKLGTGDMDIADLVTEVNRRATAAGINGTTQEKIDALLSKRTREAIAAANVSELQPNMAIINVAETKNLNDLTPETMLHNLRMVIGGELEYTGGRRVTVRSLLANERVRLGTVYPAGAERIRLETILNNIQTHLESFVTPGGPHNINELARLISSGEIREKAIPELQNAFAKLWDDVNGKPGATRWSRDTFLEQDRYIYDLVYILAGKRREVSSVGGTIA